MMPSDGAMSRRQIHICGIVQGVGFRPFVYNLAQISAPFHNTVAAIVVDVYGRIRGREGIGRVCLSGGTFQNMYLLKRAVAGLRAQGFDLFLHAKVPPNDSRIALGQAVIARAALNRHRPLLG
jgi:hydrogenase maturation factor HypF (carbamoyltransferase family)